MSTIGTLKYRRYQAKSPQNPDAPAKWYARAVQDRTVEFEDFVNRNIKVQTLSGQVASGPRRTRQVVRPRRAGPHGRIRRLRHPHL